MSPFHTTLFLILLAGLFFPAYGFPGPVGLDPLPPLQVNKPQPTKVIVRVVSHGSMVLGREVGEIGRAHV